LLSKNDVVKKRCGKHRRLTNLEIKMNNSAKSYLVGQARTLHARREMALQRSTFVQPAPELDEVAKEVQARLLAANELVESINNQCRRLSDDLKVEWGLNRRLKLEGLSQNIACLIVKLTNIDDVICDFVAKEGIQ
jgi:hypothetical protein